MVSHRRLLIRRRLLNWHEGFSRKAFRVVSVGFLLVVAGRSRGFGPPAPSLGLIAPASLADQPGNALMGLLG
jgi:hypothetical protein